MSIKEANKLILDNKHEEAYGLLLGMKPSFQMMVTKTAAEEEGATDAIKQLSKEMMEVGIEEIAVVIYDNDSSCGVQPSSPYPDVVDAQLEQRIVLIIADVHSFRADELISSYVDSCNVDDSSTHDAASLIYMFPEDVKNLVTEFILVGTEYELDNRILVLRSNPMEFLLREDQTYFRETHMQIQDTVYVRTDSPYGQTDIHGSTLMDIFTHLSNLPSEKYKHVLKIHDYESNQDPVYYSDTWLYIAREVDRIHGSLFYISDSVKPLKVKGEYKLIAEASIMKQRFFAEAVYRNMIFIHVDYLPNVNKPTNNKQQMFYDVCKLVYASTSSFITDIINPLDIAKVAEMKKEHEENLKKVDILSIPPDAGMEFLPA